MINSEHCDFEEHLRYSFNWYDPRDCYLKDTILSYEKHRLYAQAILIEKDVKFCLNYNKEISKANVYVVIKAIPILLLSILGSIHWHIIFSVLMGVFLYFVCIDDYEKSKRTPKDTRRCLADFRSAIIQLKLYTNRNKDKT